VVKAGDFEMLKAILEGMHARVLVSACGSALERVRIACAIEEEVCDTHRYGKPKLDLSMIDASNFKYSKQLGCVQGEIHMKHCT
jgi:hypothetical protein